MEPNSGLIHLTTHLDADRKALLICNETGITPHTLVKGFKMQFGVCEHYILLTVSLIVGKAFLFEPN